MKETNEIIFNNRREKKAIKFVNLSNEITTSEFLAYDDFLGLFALIKQNRCEIIEVINQ